MVEASPLETVARELTFQWLFFAAYRNSTQTRNHTVFGPDDSYLY
jgi:hypothetical protein